MFLLPCETGTCESARMVIDVTIAAFRDLEQQLHPIPARQGLPEEAADGDAEIGGAVVSGGGGPSRPTPALNEVVLPVVMLSARPMRVSDQRALLLACCCSSKAWYHPAHAALLAEIQIREDALSPHRTRATVPCYRNQTAVRRQFAESTSALGALDLLAGTHTTAKPWPSRDASASPSQCSQMFAYSRLQDTVIWIFETTPHELSSLDTRQWVAIEQWRDIGRRLPEETRFLRHMQGSGPPYENSL
ncbi:hypothetical protein BDK51DRAFT_29047 [Blyttiomyces helicus]|uniref:Uncharacterized protein n=1 Tax=Blyttiomyces helicus TaxID=388810 RepID=A0A4P9WBI6_9FUNG|nr:hypothetical protein BDK51DRAFT_29047 [Blyttiomyces helicus]|eukprot:RKO89991.1 hypothetical protein BDK51DRAFT_29047 [Blyttiomyces helicus]